MIRYQNVSNRNSQSYLCIQIEYLKRDNNFVDHMQNPNDTGRMTSFLPAPTFLIRTRLDKSKIVESNLGYSQDSVRLSYNNSNISPNKNFHLLA